MAHVTEPNSFTNDTVADADQVNANFNAINAQVNGNLDATNIADGAISAVKLHSDIAGVLVGADGAERKYASGSFSQFWNGAASSVTASIPHGLGLTPTRLFGGTALALIGAGAGVIVGVVTADSTNVNLLMVSIAGNPNTGQTIPVSWLVIQ